MKILKIFSNEKFTNVRLNEHFNVVLAKIKDPTKKKDTHNLGKTSLIHIINFLLLDKFENIKVLLGNQVFRGRIFYLEIKTNSGQYLIIKRAIDYPSKISFKLNETELNNFTPPMEWDDDDIPFEKAKDKLNNLLCFDVLSTWKFRKSITYFLRTQQDYLDVYQLGKFSKGKHVHWKPYVFELLCFDGRLIKDKLGFEDEIKKKDSMIKTLAQEANVNLKERDRLSSLLDIKLHAKKEAEQTIDKFNFFLEENSLTNEIIDELDFKIQTLNTERYRIKYEINKTEESLKSSDNKIDLKKLKQLFDDVKLFFPTELQKQYEELEKFNNSISKERRKYLNENLHELKQELKTVNTELEQLEKDKSDKLLFLTEKDTYTKFKSYQKKLSEICVEIEQLTQKLKLIDKSSILETEITAFKEKINETNKQIEKTITKRNHAEINKIFDEILKDILNQNAIISINQNQKSNIEFSAEYVDDSFINQTSESEGTTYKKLLCMAFDLSLLIYYSKNSFFRFAYHDGVLEGLDNRVKVRLLDKIKYLCEKYNIQHIISLIDSDIPSHNDGSKYSFEKQEICLELHDLNDDGKLFKESF